MNALIERLHDPGLLPGAGSEVICIETHISWVLLCADYAYKLKKPLDLGFLDFSTLARRQQACCDELRLNARLSPQLYLQVLPISGTPESPRVGDDSEPFEYCVQMRRFNPEQQLDHLYQHDALDDALMGELGRTLGQFHQQLPGAPEESDFGSLIAVIGPIRDNFLSLRSPGLRSLLPKQVPAMLERLEQSALSTTEQLQQLIEDRHRQGFIREGHGDLHLGNLVVHQSRICLFDCLEFSAELRWIDVINDLAFLLMDLHHRGMAQAAWRLLDSYLEVTGDFDGMALLRLYMSYRAMVRAKIAGIRLQQISVAERPTVAQELLSYTKLAERIDLRAKPTLVLCCGVSGSGKSQHSQALLGTLGAIRLRSDVERKRLAGLQAHAHSSSAVSAGLYSSAMTERVYAQLLASTDALLQQDYPVIVDASFLRQSQRQPFIALADRLGIDCRILHCNAPHAVLVERVQQRLRQGTDPSEATPEVLEHQLAVREDFIAEEAPLCINIDTSMPFDPQHSHQALLDSLSRL